jgi:poly(3-hydroxybutyrate) depolymerase
VLHVPKGLGSAKVPLVINLHGSNGTGEKEESLTGMDTVADSGKFIVAYPDDYTAKDVKALIKALEANGIAPVAGPMVDALEPLCGVPYKGGTVNSEAAESVGITLGHANVLSAEATLSFWRKEDGCRPHAPNSPRRWSSRCSARRRHRAPLERNQKRLYRTAVPTLSAHAPVMWPSGSTRSGQHPGGLRAPVRDLYRRNHPRASFYCLRSSTVM